MSKQQGKSNIADDAARARKLLDKHAPVKVSGLNKSNYTLQQGVNQNLGEHAVIVVIGGQTTHQYTISRPIGVTDGDEKLDWVINSTEYLPSMMARKVDPTLGALNQQRAQLRTQLAVDNGLLVSKQIGDKHVHFYPNREDMSRNDLLQGARASLKEDQQELRRQFDAATDKQEKAAFAAELATLTDPLEYLDTATAASEENLRKFWQSDEVQEVLETEAPQLYRTLTGPYADQPQVIINGAKGKSLDSVVNAISAKIAKVAFESVQSDPAPPALGNPEKEGTGASVAMPTTQSTTGSSTKKNSRTRVADLAKSIFSKSDAAASKNGNFPSQMPTDGGGVTPHPPNVDPPTPPKE
jgi:hypothetical protein